MILTTINADNGTKTTVSDEGYKIRKVGTSEIYEEAVDLLDASYTYEETDIPIEPTPE